MSYENGQQDAWLEAMRQQLDALRDDWRQDMGSVRDELKANRREVCGVQIQVAQLAATIETREEERKDAEEKAANERRAAAAAEQARLTRRVTIISLCVSAVVGIAGFVYRVFSGK